MAHAAFLHHHFHRHFLVTQIPKGLGRFPPYPKDSKPPLSIGKDRESLLDAIIHVFAYRTPSFGRLQTPGRFHGHACQRPGAMRQPPSSLLSDSPLLLGTFISASHQSPTPQSTSNAGWVSAQTSLEYLPPHVPACLHSSKRHSLTIGHALHRR
jgi:hypothetical protein